MRLTFLLALSVGLLSCDSGGAGSDTPARPTGPSGSFRMEQVSFRLFRVVDRNRGITEDLQGTVNGSLSLAVSGGQVTGSGTCSWTSRRYVARTAHEELASGSQSFTLAGTLTGSDAWFILEGCVWNQVGYRGEFDGERYVLRLQDPLAAPIFDQEIWRNSEVISGDPLALELFRP